MHVGSTQARWLPLFSYIIALAFDIMMLLDDAATIVPPITLMALLYWSANVLTKTHLLSAFVLGLLLDSVYQSTLGAHALIFSVFIFLMLRHRLRFRTYTLWRQAFLIGIYMMLYQLFNFLTFNPVLEAHNYLQYWAMPLLSMFIWPLLALAFSRLTTRDTQG